MLEINASSREDSLLVHLRGRFDGAGGAAFDGFAAGAAAPGCDWVLDFQAVDYLSSAGIRSLITLVKKLLKEGSSLALAGVQPSVAQVLQMTGLLDKFLSAPTVAEAAALCRQRRLAREAWQEVRCNGKGYVLHRLTGGGGAVETWAEPGGLTADRLQAGQLIAVSLAELGLAFGTGGLGGSRQQAADALGPFVATGNLAAVLPADGQGVADFMLAQNPAESTFYLAEATGFPSPPDLRLELPGERVTLAQLAADLPFLLESAGRQGLAAVGLVILAEQAEVSGSYCRTLAELPGGVSEPLTLAGPSPLLVLGLTGVAPTTQTAEGGVCRLFPAAAPGEKTAAPLFRGHGVILSDIPVAARGPEGLSALWKIVTPENLVGVCRVQPDTLLHEPQVWVFPAVECTAGESRRLQIQVEGSEAFPEEWEIIARRIYAGASRVTLQSLPGGYSATTYHVESRDRHGRRQIPTVLKISTHDFSGREEFAYHQYVKNFILNNSAIIMGAASRGDWAGLRYNFLGITGADTHLTWLGEHFARRPPAELTAIFETLFTKILWPWYGQPILGLIHPYADHDPSDLFPRIPEDAEKFLGISPTAVSIACPELCLELPNPYLFLRQHYPLRQSQSWHWPTSITHGDLNLNNILLDERDNIYVIDFSETRPRSIVADLARLEPLLVVQLPRLEGQADREALAEFYAGLAEPESLDGTPPFCYRGTDPLVEKIYHTVCLLRRLAARFAAPSRDLVPYLLGVLQWTYSIVSFRQMTDDGRKMSMYYAALLCQRILALERQSGTLPTPVAPGPESVGC